MHRLSALLERAVLISHSDLTELLENLLERTFREPSESAAQIAHCELKLCWHPEQRDENVQVDECLHDVLLLGFVQVVPAVLMRLLRKDDDEAAEKLSQLFEVFVEDCSQRRLVRDLLEKCWWDKLVQSV